MPGFESPFSGVGNLRNEMQGELSRKANAYDLSSLSSKVDSLERTLGNACSEISRMCYKIQELEESQERMKEQMEEEK